MKHVFSILCASSVIISTACAVESYPVPDPTHCANNSGDPWCGEQHPDGSAPYCRLGTQVCDEAAGITDFDIDGCFAEPPEDACWSACGNAESILDDPECEGTVSGMSSSGGMTDSGSTTEDMSTTDDGMTTTTGVPGCMGNEDCTEAGLPFCGDDGECVSCDAMTDGDAACAGLSPGMPVCEGGECVQCSDDNAVACIGQTPTCGAGNSCVACSEHSDCAESACHLDGPDVGACFDVADVVNVANAGELDAALAGLGADSQAVFVLAAGTYATSINVGMGAEVAILGQSNATIAGDGGLNAAELIGNSITYLHGVAVANINGNGVNCSGTSVWLDDSDVRNNSQVGMDVSGGCAAHLRRSAVANNDGGGIVADGATTALSLENSIVHDNVSGAAGPGVRLLSADAEIAYSAVVSNGTFASPTNIECLSGAVGTVRNSIVSGPNGDSIVLCDGLSWENNGVDTMGLGETNTAVGTFDAEWFVDTATGNYHLSTTGETTFMDIAQWQNGDPLTDIDGEAIPTVMPSFPGYDQP